MRDDEELERELSWNDPDEGPDRARRLRARPPGANVVLAIAALLTAALAGGYLWAVGGVSTEHGLAPIVTFVVVCVVSALVARAASRWIWRHLGVLPRRVLRPFGRLGAGGVLFVLVVLVAVAAALVNAAGDSATTGHSFAESLRGGAFSGTDFVVRTDGNDRFQKGTPDDAARFCAARGPGWRLPAAGDEAFLTSRLTLHRLREGGEEIAGAPSPSEGPFAWSPTAGRFQRTLPVTPGGSAIAASTYVVVCIRP